ncbi:MAG: 16S rRNA (cytosine(1402)-N(4))-methyltransferase RsmH [Bacteroidales bacterium]|jgi:16S rRNA (cytosine1402-N4)-methyltransferase|nr:16S rRNA (cytosine(1402)-N(4))-methyltransferase RsmH [Bacteroidales bacterium]
MNYHEPVLLAESIENLAINPNGVYIDATFGGGGHSALILKYLQHGRLFGFDQDEDATQNIPDSKNFTFVHHNFKYIRHFMRYYGVEQVDGILADLGVSSHHFDTPERGFSFRFNAPLDMRMDQTTKLTAATILNTYEEIDLRRIFKEYGEIANAYKLAQLIVREREIAPIETTEALKKIGQRLCNPKTETKYLSQIFQALRIEVNDEMGVLRDFLQAGLAILKPGGRFVIITYHSLEDRMVKNFFKTGNCSGAIEKDFYGNVKTPFELVHKKAIMPSEQEIEKNNRARSAKLRVAEKLNKKTS